MKPKSKDKIQKIKVKGQRYKKYKPQEKIYKTLVIVQGYTKYMSKEKDIQIVKRQICHRDAKWCIKNFIIGGLELELYIML